MIPDVGICYAILGNTVEEAIFNCSLFKDFPAEHFQISYKIKVPVR